MGEAPPSVMSRWRAGSQQAKGYRGGSPDDSGVDIGEAEKVDV